MTNSKDTDQQWYAFGACNMASYVVVDDLDGNAVHTVDAGALAEVRDRADARLQKQIDAAIAAGGECTETFTRDGEEYTTQVVISVR